MLSSLSHFCLSLFIFFFFKQKTAYEMRISDWSSDVCSSVLSRELAEAKADYLSALRQESLASTTLRREKDLWLKKVSAEQDYLDARTAAATAQITLDAADRKSTRLNSSH